MKPAGQEKLLFAAFEVERDGDVVDSGCIDLDVFAGGDAFVGGCDAKFCCALFLTEGEFAAYVRIHGRDFSQRAVRVYSFDLDIGARDAVAAFVIDAAVYDDKAAAIDLHDEVAAEVANFAALDRHLVFYTGAVTVCLKHYVIDAGFQPLKLKISLIARLHRFEILAVLPGGDRGPADAVAVHIADLALDAAGLSVYRRQ